MPPQAAQRIVVTGGAGFIGSNLVRLLVQNGCHVLNIEKLIPVVILRCLRGDPIPIYGDGSNVRDWLHVDDHCRALFQVASRGRIGETYVIGGNHELSNLELVRQRCQILDRMKPADDGVSYTQLIEFVGDRPGHDFRYAIDASKIRNELGWCPTRHGAEGMQETVRWYLENESWWTQIMSGDYRLNRIGHENVAPRS